MKKRIFLLLLITCYFLKNYGQNFTNGSFEINTLSNCVFNINNSQFNSYFIDIKGIGGLQSLDAFYDLSCSFGAAKTGHYFVSVENTTDSTKSTAISLKLSDTLKPGMPYSLCFFDRGLTIGVGPVQIGVSNNDSTFGLLIYTAPTADTIWTKRSISFNSPITARFVTARYKNGAIYNGVLIDDFSICTTAHIDEKFAEIKSIIFPIPNNGTFNLNIDNEVKNAKILLINYLGQKVHEQKIFQGENQIITSGLAIGLYNYILLQDKQKTGGGKLVIE